MDDYTTIPVKRCNKCGVEYPATTEFFYAAKGGKHGVFAKCKPCCKKYQEENADRVRLNSRRYYERHQEEVKTRSHDWYHTNKPRAAATAKAWASNNAEASRTIKKRYKKSHPEMNRVYKNRRRARILAVGGDFNREDIAIQFKAQKGLCWWCSKKIKEKYHVDHRIPISRGGSNDPSNICITCPECNLKKNDKMPWEFNGRLL